MIRQFVTFRRWLLILISLLSAATAFAADPMLFLQNGGKVTVDPYTNRAMVTRGGVSTPLWDGTHRLQDGSILVINRGVAVPNRRILDSRRLPPPEPEETRQALIAGYSPCEKLVHRVCGTQDQCAETEGCSLARQLVDMELEERIAADNPNLMTYTSGQCLTEGNNFGIFPGCAAASR